MITVSAFRCVPPFAQGLVRDLRVRWALEEAGIPYREKLIGPEDQGTADAAAKSARGCAWSRCFVLHTSGESELLQVAQPDKDKTKIKPRNFFIHPQLIVDYFVV